MAEVSLNINGQTYEMECDDGQESRVYALGDHVDAKLQEIAGAGAASNDNHLLVLTALMLSDEIFELREQVQNAGSESSEGNSKDDAVVAQSIEKLAERIQAVTQKIESA